MENIIWEDNSLMVLDQTLLPHQIEYVKCTNHLKVCDLIKRLAVRGAPLIGVVAGYGMVLAAISYDDKSDISYIDYMKKANDDLGATRPTAVNLFWALDQMKSVWLRNGSISELLSMAHKIYQDDCASCNSIGEYGKAIIPNNAGILTHCNAGSLATATYGTALGVIKSAYKDGKVAMVYADETRPLLQGSRLTAFELMNDNIPVTLITDNMAAHIMSEGLVDVVIVGADRIAVNGDTANKIGTYGVAILARYHKIPFYIAAPLSTFDLSIQSGNDIVIEERDRNEIISLAGVKIAPNNVRVRNPAFDITPGYLIAGLITEYGIIKNPDAENIILFMQGVKDGQSK